MSGMFNLCTLPTGFTLGRLFNTFKVEDMRSMFAHAQIEDGFNLGEEFDTRNVQKMNGIFMVQTYLHLSILEGNLKLIEDFTIVYFALVCMTIKILMSMLNQIMPLQ